MSIVKLNSGRRYVPVVRIKRGEMNALRHLKHNTNCCPMLQITPDIATGRRIRVAEEAWPAPRLAFLDASQTKNLDLVNDWLTELTSKISYIPTITPIASQQQIANRMIREAINAQQGCCIRLLINNTTVARTYKVLVKNICKSTKTTSSNTDILLDFGEINNAAHIYVPSALAIVHDLLTIGDWRSITIAGSSFPATLPQDSVHNFLSIPRKEWEIWKQAAHATEYPLDYGDYTTQPAVVGDLSMIDGSKIASKLRYTTNDEWLVAKGRGGQGADYHTLAKQLTSSQHFCGPTFSHGDAHIFACAGGGSHRPGSHETRVTVDVNHHIEFVLAQL